MALNGTFECAECSQETPSAFCQECFGCEKCCECDSDELWIPAYPDGHVEWDKELN